MRQKGTKEKCIKGEMSEMGIELIETKRWNKRKKEKENVKGTEERKWGKKKKWKKRRKIRNVSG